MACIYNTIYPCAHICMSKKNQHNIIIIMIIYIYRRNWEPPNVVWATEQCGNCWERSIMYKQKGLLLAIIILIASYYGVNNHSNIFHYRSTVMLLLKELDAHGVTLRRKHKLQRRIYISKVSVMHSILHLMDMKSL